MIWRTAHGKFRPVSAETTLYARRNLVSRMHLMRSSKLLFTCAAALALTPVADARDTHDWIVRAGLHPIAPKPHNHPTLKVDDSFAVSLGVTYLFTKHWALEVFGTLPIEHDLSIDRDQVGSFEMVPATLMIQYHITDAQQRLRAYTGLGVAYANLTHERSDGAFASSNLELAHSTGFAVAAGLDMNVSKHWFVSVNARWLDIDANVQIDATDLGRLRVDPYAFGMSIGRRLR